MKKLLIMVSFILISYGGILSEESSIPHPTPENPISPQIYYVKPMVLDIKEKPSLSSKTLLRLPPGTRLETIPVNGSSDWLEIKEGGGFVSKSNLSLKEENWKGNSPGQVLTLKRKESGDCSECMTTTDYLMLYNNRVRHLDLGEPDHGYGDGINYRFTRGTYTVEKGRLIIRLEKKQLSYHRWKEGSREYNFRDRHSGLGPIFSIASDEDSEISNSSPDAPDPLIYSEKLKAFLPGEGFLKIINNPKSYTHAPEQKGFMGLKYEKSNPYHGYFLEVQKVEDMENDPSGTPKEVDGVNLEEFFNLRKPDLGGE
ncbi:MAG: hypothetical protein H7A24_09910 [Leptospiraceae bacterium]|nr:hypothetical protein [Leptospiraceae bacterium]MCP5512184.1 hypothetical protein [Leptospiraceae bacterium]